MGVTPLNRSTCHLGYCVVSQTNHPCQVLCQSVKGFLRGSTPKSAISYTFWTTLTTVLHYRADCDFVLIEFILWQFLYFAVLAWNCLFVPIVGGFGEHISSKSPIVLTPNRTIRRLSHKAWTRVQRFDLIEKKGKGRTGQSKSHKVVIFRLGEITSNIHSASI